MELVVEEEGVSDSVPLPPPLMSSTTGPGKRDREGDRSVVNMERYGCICMYIYICIKLYMLVCSLCLRFSCAGLNLLKGLHVACADVL